MRSPRLLATFLVLLTFLFTPLFSQTGSGIFNYPFSNDSLAGFDEQAMSSFGVTEGLYGGNYTAFLYYKKRAFIDTKYNLYKNVSGNNLSYSIGSSLKTIGGVNAILAAPCVNEGFENGTVSNWVGSSGQNTNSSCVYAVTPLSSPTLQVLSTPFSDNVVNITVPNSPFAGSHVVRLNDSNNDYGVSRIAQTFPVTSSNFLYEFSYLAVMATNHVCCDQTYMQVKLYNFNGTPLSCPLFTFAPPPSGTVASCSSPGIVWTNTIITLGGTTFSVCYNPTWQNYSIDLTNYINQNITVEITVSDCDAGGHWGYSYFDSNCNQLGFTLNNTTFVAAPSQTVNLTGLCAQTATITAPVGLGPYTWTGPTGSFTTQTIATGQPGTYTLSMNPAGSCLPITRIINLTFPPPTTITASSTNLCATGSNTITTIIANGASSYTWQPGGVVSSSILVSPTSTTIYTVTAQTGTCVGTYTTLITVNPDPSINVLSSNSSLCPGQTATLIANGASSYVWNPGGLTGSVVVISQSSTTTYTVIGTSTAGCSGTATTAITSSSALPISIFPATVAAICPGTAVSMIGIGAPSFTWLPNGVTGIFQTFTPTVTTTFTAIGASGTCTNSAVITVTVDQGPPIVIVANPTITCPGNTTTLTATSSSAVGSFTWQPGSANTSAISVTTALTGGYSVSAVNALGCINTQTFNPSYTPAPIIVVSPSTPSICAGASVSLLASGALNYTWVPTGQTGANASFSPSTTTTYTVIGENVSGCSGQTTVSIVVVPIPTINASASPTAVCPGSCATVSPSGAATYVIDGGSMVVCPTSNTVYSIVGTNAAGCQSNPITLSVNVNPVPSVNVAANPASICAGSSSTLNASGATSYTWSDSSNGTSLVVTPASTQSYTVTGANTFGCTNSTVVAVTVIPAPVIAVTPAASTICPGGSVSPSATGATSYTWNPGGVTGSNPTFNPSSTTIYTVIGANGACLGQTLYPVTIAPVPVITATYAPGTICAGDCATLSATGSVTNFIVSGLTPVACPTITTSYSVVGVSADGCLSNTVTGTLFVNNGPVLLASANPTAICPGDSSLLSASGASSYTWQPGNNFTSSFFAKPTVTTTYTVTGINVSGCTSSVVTTLVVNPVPVVGVSPTATTICPGDFVTLTANGATTYTWIPGGTGSSIVVSPSVTTIYSVTGANGGCSGTNSVLVTVAPVPVISASFNPPTICAGSCATISTTGGATYTITGLSGVACPLATSPYTVVGSNAFGCISLPVVGTLSVLPAPNISASANPTVICPGDSTTITGAGGLTYNFLPGNSNGPSLVDHPLTTTVYTVTGTDVSGCTAIALVTVSVNSVPAIFAISTPTTICGGGSATLSAAGATSFNWSPGSLTGASVVVTPVVTTIYTVTGLNGTCSGSTTVLVNVDQTPTVNISTTSQTICAGGSVTLSLTGASTYSWNDGSNAASRVETPSVTTTYSIIGFSANGCVGLPSSITISVNPAPSIIASANPASICAGGSSTLNATGGLSYLWSPGNMSGTSPVVSPSVTTAYQVIGTDAFGCDGIAFVTVTVTPGLNITASASQSVLCGAIVTTLTASGGATSYSWFPGPLTGSVVLVIPVSSTVYTLIAANGACSTQVLVPIIVNTNVSVTLTASSTSICAGTCATLTASGASSYTWSDGSTGSNDIVCPGVTTTYSVIGGAGACTDMQQVTIFVTPAPSLSITGTQNTLCASNPATLTASGASTYSWSTGATTSVIIVAPSITTVYNVIGFNGSCSSSLNYTQTVVAPGNFSIVASSPSICAGFTVGLLAVGAVGNYTWQPNGFVGNPLVDSPTSTTIYTANLNNGGCPTTATVSVVVVPLPNISLSANPQSVCSGGTTTLTASGGVTYSWIPTLVGGSTFTDNPVVATTYTVVGFDASGCPNVDTISVGIINPAAITASASASTLCQGSTATLTASGSINYTWLPGGLSGTSVTVSPTANTIYTVTGGSGACLGTATVAIVIAPLPVISASASNPSICPGSSVQLSATGVNTYTWLPTGQTGQQITDFPSASTNYTVVGTDANGCTAAANVFVFVNPMSNIIALASPSNICAGDSSTLSANGGLSYTWNPGGQTSSTLIVNPAASTIYTLMANDASGCTGSFTLAVNVTPIPTLNVSPLNSSICVGSTATLTVTGATNYTWLPGGSTSSVTFESPTVPTTYTVIGDVNGICATSQTVTVFVNPLPAHVGASSTGTVSCNSPTAQLFGSCTDTNVSYFWASASFTTIGQNPVISGVWGTFTLSVIDNVTGCVATATVDVPTDNSIPFVTAVASGSITCAVSTVVLNAVNSTTNAGYSWSGPSGFTSTIQSPTVNTQGIYTITVTDLTSLCSATAVVTVGTHTTVAITASISPATCNSNGTSNNNGSISVSGFTLTDKYDLVSGASYTGTTTYATAASIPVGGILTNNLANPTTTLAYTIRLFDGQGCVKDTTLYLVPVDCSLRTLGIAKAVSAPRVNSDGSYNVTYTVVVKNYDQGPLKDVALVENLSTTFPTPTTFTVIPDSTYISANTSLSINNLFDGSSQTNLLVPGSNSIAPGQVADTIRFTVKVKTNKFFIGFKNTVLGSATNIDNKALSDSSNTGLEPDPDNDSNPFNNNNPTVVIFNPMSFFGITKVGEIHKIDKDSYDVTYTISVHNLGNDTIRNVILKDSLFEMAIRNPVTYSMKSAPISNGGGLVANSAYNGNLDINLVNGLDSKIPPGTTSSVYFTINIIPGTVTAISNSAYGNGIIATSPTGTMVLSDTSNAGTNPDINGNGIWNEASDNVPTVLLVPNTHSLFIPEGFSPDGDAYNQYFVIQGLSELGGNSITIFNRWGNKVYANANYDNTWDGTPNVSGTLGKDKLPPGTYYYILEMKGTGLKAITGFVVLQY